MISVMEKGTGNSRVRAVLNMLAKQSFMEKVTFEAWERVVRMFLEKHGPGRRKNRFKSLEAEVCLVCLKSNNETSMAGVGK